MYISTVLLFFTIIITNHRLRIFSTRLTPLSFALILYVFVQVIPGVLLVSFFDFPMSYGLSNSITKEVKVFTLVFTFWSLILLLFLLYFLSFIVDFDIDFSEFYIDFKTCVFVFVFSTILIIYKLFSVDGWPLVSAISGDPELAAFQKSQILKGNSGAGGFLIGYVFEYFYLVALSYLYLAKRKGIVNIIFYFFLALCVLYAFYDLQKFKFIYLSLYFSALIILIDGFQIKKVLLLILFGFILLSASFLLLGHADLNNIIFNIVSRTFVGQMEGSYMIYEALKPEISRIYYGLPLSFLFFEGVVTDPSADVVRIFFPEASEAWVNSNTYVLAHAWSIFGFFSLFIMPFFVAFNILILIFLRDVFKNFIGIFSYLIYFSLLMSLKINNDFSFFLYLKMGVGFLSIAIFCLIIIIFKNTFNRVLRELSWVSA